ncbi:uncharacterized protein LOC126333259 [Schistocerca gregaria]|uniref:uncharacterized protein LOC126333259 n=1 Tax=Schistocerca gregaria TaxID=7010 RepID=UPI00211DCB3B|nr:uncharacterized protein LOC126333259 [Schistocerca gregaria]
MLGSRSDAVPSNKEEDLDELLLLFRETAGSEWPSEARDFGADDTGVLAYRSRWRAPRCDKDAEDASTYEPDSTTDDGEGSGTSPLNISASESVFSNQLRATVSILNGRPQQDTEMSAAWTSCPPVAGSSAPSTRNSTYATPFPSTENASCPLQMLDDLNRAHSSRNGSDFDIPIAGSSTQTSSISVCYMPPSLIANTVSGGGEFFENDQPTDLSLPKIVPRDVEPVHATAKDSNDDHPADFPTSKKLPNVSNKLKDEVHGNQRPPTPCPAPNMRENHQHQQTLPPGHPSFVVMGPPNVSYQYHESSAVMVGEDGSFMVLHSIVVPPPVTPLVFPVWQPEMCERSSNVLNEEIVVYEFSDVSDEDELEQNHRPKIIEIQDGQAVQSELLAIEYHAVKNEPLEEDGEALRNELLAIDYQPLNNEPLQEDGEAVQNELLAIDYQAVQNEPVGKSSENSDAECAAAGKEIMHDENNDEKDGAENRHSQNGDQLQEQKEVNQSCTDQPQSGPSGVVLIKGLQLSSSPTEAAASFKHLGIPSEQIILPVAQSQLRLTSPPGESSSPTVKSTSSTINKPPEQSQPLNELQHTEQPQVARSSLQATSPSIQIPILSNDLYNSPEANRPLLLQPVPAYVQQNASPPHLLQKQSNPLHPPLCGSPGPDGLMVQISPPAVQASTSSGRSDLSSARKSSIKTNPSCTSVSKDHAVKNVNSLTLSGKLMPIQLALAHSPLVQPAASPMTNELPLDQAEHQPVPSVSITTVCDKSLEPSMQLLVSPVPSPTQKKRDQVSDDGTSATQLSSASTLSPTNPSSQANSSQPPTASPPAGRHQVQSPAKAVGQDSPLQLPEFSSPEHQVQSPPTAVGQDSPLQLPEFSISLLYPRSPKLSGVATKSKAIAKRSREPWDHKGLFSFVVSFAFSLPRHIWTQRREGEPRRSVRIAEKLKAKRYFLRPRFPAKRGTGE